MWGEGEEEGAGGEVVSGMFFQIQVSVSSINHSSNQFYHRASQEVQSSKLTRHCTKYEFCVFCARLISHTRDRPWMENMDLDLATLVLPDLDLAGSG